MVTYFIMLSNYKNHKKTFSKNDKKLTPASCAFWYDW